MEPKQHASKIDEHAQKFGFPKYEHASLVNCHIWLFWVQEVDIMVLDSSDQHITVQVRKSENPSRVSFIYAKCTHAERHELWNHLRANNISDIPWLVGSDFNNIIRASEKRGGLLPDTGSMQDFQECLVDANMSEIGFTWSLHGVIIKPETGGFGKD